jgi:O-antigen/teichoic acid export membrane protein
MGQAASVPEPALVGDEAALRPAIEVARHGRLAANVLWLLGSNVLYAGCQWGAVVALAKLAPPASLGYFGLALAVSNPVVLVTGFSLKAYQSTDVLGRYRFTDYVNLRLLANVVAGGIIGAIAAASVLGGPEVAVLIPVAFAKLSDATSETCYGLAQKHGRMRFVALSKTTRGAAGLAALVVVVALGGTVAHGAWALALTWAMFLLAVDFQAARSLEPVLGRSGLPTLARLARETAPLGAVSGVEALTQSLPRYLLQMSRGAAAVGYYTALSSVVPALAQLAGAVGNGAAPSLGWTVSSDAARYRLLVRRLMAAGVVTSALLVAGAVLVGRPFLSLAYAQDYAVHHTTFVLVVLAGGFAVVNQVSYFALVAARRLGLLLGIQCLGLLVTALGGLLLVGSLGLIGVATGAALGAATMAALGAWALLLQRGRP